ncbi:hypothetical protein PCI56_25975 [Plesiomonas shigelloides subsp. oncorhynchi]|nr:hypothetical protein [Plesiomonas shigelloides]
MLGIELLELFELLQVITISLLKRALAARKQRRIATGDKRFEPFVSGGKDKVSSEATSVTGTASCVTSSRLYFIWPETFSANRLAAMNAATSTTKPITIWRITEAFFLVHRIQHHRYECATSGIMLTVYGKHSL